MLVIISEYHFQTDQTLTSPQVLRGCRLKNTGWVIGVVVYTGHQSKLMMNAGKPRRKRSSLEKSANSGIIILFIFEFLSLTFSALSNAFWTKDNQSHWYIYPVPLTTAAEFTSAGVVAFFTYFVLYAVMVPISLYVTLEFAKVFLARLIEQDLLLYQEETETPCKARTSNLLEQLGQVDYIFSDKTGTLTRNEMEFMKCTIAGESYGAGLTEIMRATMLREGRTPPPDPAPLPGMPANFRFSDHTLLNLLVSEDPQGKAARRFFTALSVCHTVYPKDDGDDVTFEASSPDELALVTAADNLGFSFRHRTASAIVLDIQGNDRAYEVLNILEFSSDRKRMSVITRDYKGRLVIWCKGADTVILPRLRAGQDELRNTTMQHIEAYANEGLRTLLFARRPLKATAYEAWSERYNAAALAMVDREAKVAEVAEEIEKDFLLLGATGIEDKLQKGVSDTLVSLENAGIKIWMLTGDKQETAINIAFACSLMRNDMKQYILNTTDPDATLQALHEIAVDIRTDLHLDRALVIDGAALVPALNELREEFLEV